MGELGFYDFDCVVDVTSSMLLLDRRDVVHEEVLYRRRPLGCELARGYLVCLAEVS